MLLGLLVLVLIDFLVAFDLLGDLQLLQGFKVFVPLIYSTPGISEHDFMIFGDP